jgi:hypothetical protein
MGHNCLTMMAMETKEFKYCSVMKKIFYPGPIRAAKAGPKFLVYTGMMSLTK